MAIRRVLHVEGRWCGRHSVAAAGRRMELCGCPAVSIGASPLTYSMLRLMYTVAGPTYPESKLDARGGEVLNR